jgi:hypothetical protein
MRTSLWDIVFEVAAVFGALVGAVYFALAQRDGDRRLAGAAAVGFSLFSIAAVLYFWRFL